jgi:hypothetical protein
MVTNLYITTPILSNIIFTINGLYNLYVLCCEKNVASFFDKEFIFLKSVGNLNAPIISIEWEN